MELYLTNTAAGLVPMYDSDYDEKKKLKIGQAYRADIRLARNLQFHRKYFALINCAWEYLDEKAREFYGENRDGFRKTLEIAAGWYEPVYDLQKRDFIHAPRSISFSSMRADQFEQLYSRVKDVLFLSYLKGVDAEEFEKNLMNF
jgi:hypothetical protein